MILRTQGLRIRVIQGWQTLVDGRSDSELDVAQPQGPTLGALTGIANLPARE